MNPENVWRPVDPTAAEMGSKDWNPNEDETNQEELQTSIDTLRAYTIGQAINLKMGDSRLLDLQTAADTYLTSIPEDQRDEELEEKAQDILAAAPIEI